MTLSEAENGYRLLGGNDMNTNEILQVSVAANGGALVCWPNFG